MVCSYRMYSQVIAYGTRGGRNDTQKRDANHLLF